MILIMMSIPLLIFMALDFWFGYKIKKEKFERIRKREIILGNNGRVKVPDRKEKQYMKFLPPDVEMGIGCSHNI